MLNTIPIATLPTSFNQGPTAPDDVYDLFLRFLSLVDTDAVVEDPDTGDISRAVPGTLPGVLLTEFESVKDSHLRTLLALPYQDMKIVLTELLYTEAIPKQVCEKLSLFTPCSLISTLFPHSFFV